MTRPNDIEPFGTYLEHGTVREMEADPSTARNLYKRQNGNSTTWRRWESATRPQRIIDHLNVDAKTAHRFNKFRKLRNDIAYRGDVATEREAEEMRALFEQLLDDLGSDLEDRLS